MTFPRAALSALVVIGLTLAGCSGPAGPTTAGPSSVPNPASGASLAGQPAQGPDTSLDTGASTGPAQQLAARLAGTDTATIAPVAAAPGRRIISVTAVGKATGTPDTVTVQLGVQTRAASAGAALSENNVAANKVIDRLRKAGVADQDLQTSQLSIYPTYSDGGSSITGYQVSNVVIATLHEIAKAGALVDAAQQAAGNAVRLEQISFSFADDSALRRAARIDAVKQALAQAKQLADAAALTLGPVLSLTEGSQSSPPQPMYAAADAAGGAGPSMPVLPGSADITVEVQMVVAIG